MEAFTKLVYVAIGGAFGAVTRYGLSLIFANTLTPFPFATFLINVTGSFLVGFAMTKFEGNETLRLLLISGFLGAYTTFSTFEFETFSLTQTKQIAMAFAYVSLSFAIGLIGVFAGVWVGKKFT
jgi:fluoride exporter